MLFCDRTSGRISLAGLLVAGFMAGAALPGWAQTTDDSKPIEPRAAPPTAATRPAAATSPDPRIADDNKRESDKPQFQPARAGTMGAVTEVKDDILLVQLTEGVSLPGNSPVFVIRITPTHSEMIGQLRILKTDGQQVVAKLEPQVSKPQVGDQLWPVVRAATARDNYVPAHARNVATEPYRPAWVAASSELNEGGSTFQLEDGSKIIARLDANGTLRVFLEKDGKRQELSKSKDSTRTVTNAATGSTSPWSTLPMTSRGTSARASTAPMTQHPPSFSTAARTEPSSELAVLETNLELAKLEVEEKDILLKQAQDLEKQKVISPIEVRLKEVELRKAQVRLKQAQLQIDATRPKPQPAGANSY